MLHLKIFHRFPQEFLQDCAETSKRYTRTKTKDIVKQINEITTELYNYLSERYGTIF